MLNQADVFSERSLTGKVPNCLLEFRHNLLMLSLRVVQRAVIFRKSPRKCNVPGLRHFLLQFRAKPFRALLPRSDHGNTAWHGTSSLVLDDKVSK